MTNPLQEALKELESLEIVVDVNGKKTGLVSKEAASLLLQMLEIKILNQYGPVTYRSGRNAQTIPENQRSTVALAEEWASKLPKTNS